MKNLFDKAKETGTSKVKAEKHEIVEMPQFTSQLEKLANIDAKMAELQATRDLIDSEIRETSKETMISLYEKRGSFPGTLKVVAGERSFLFITSDRYLKVDKDRYEELVKMFGPEVVDEKTRYFFNNEILEKYQEVISDLILKSKKISDADKAKLIESETTYTIKKGLINDLATIGKKFKSDVKKMVEEIRPIFNIKMTEK